MTTNSIRSAVVACAVGVIAGFAYTLSPVTIWFLLAMVVLMFVAARGSVGRERVWLLSLLSVAIGLRLLVVAAVFLSTDDAATGDFAAILPDEPYVARRALWLLNIALGVPLAPADYSESANAYGWTSQHHVLAYLQLQLGVAPYGIRLLSVFLYVGAAVILYRIVRPSFGGLAALIGVAITLFFPSSFVWSISLLKEPYLAFLGAIGTGAIVTATRTATTWKRALSLLTFVAVVMFMGTVRTAAGVMLGSGVLLGLATLILVRRPLLLAVTVVFGVVVIYSAFQRPFVQQQAIDTIRQAVAVHIGHVRTTGYAYKLLDPEIYQQVVDGTSLDEVSQRVTPGAAVRFVIRAALSFVLFPLPWSLDSTSGVMYIPEQVLWLLLHVLALGGVIVGVRRDPTLTFVLLGIIFVSGAIIAMSNGNFGTLVRIRSMVMMPLAWLAGIGVSGFLGRVAMHCYTSGSVAKRLELQPGATAGR